MAASDRSPPRLEIQILPGDVRRRPRSIRLGPLGLRALLGCLFAYGIFLAVGLGFAPGALRDLASLPEYRAAVQTQRRLLEHLSVLGERFRLLSEEAGELRSRLNKVHLVYGLDGEATRTVSRRLSAPAPAATARGENLAQAVDLLEGIVVESVSAVGSFVDEIEGFEAAYKEQVRVTPAMSPLRGAAFVLTASMGYEISPFTQQQQFHPGIDLAAARRTPVYAPADGRIVFAGTYPLSRRSSWWRLGKMVALRSGDLFVTLFGHCDEIKVRRGQTVKRGDLLATVGDSGWSSHTRLHYGVWRRSGDEFQPVDPRLYILDHRWEDDEQLLLAASEPAPVSSYDRLPRALGGG